MRVKPSRWSWYPAPTSAVRLRHAAERSGGRYVVVREEHRPDWSQLRYVDGEPVEFRLELPRVMREEAVGWVGKAVVTNHQAWPVTSRGELIIDAITLRRRKPRQHARNQRLMRPTRLRGDTLNITCSATAMNYSHVMIDGIGRLGVAAGAGIDFSTLDHVIVPGHPTSNLGRLLDLAGIPPEKRRPAVIGAHYEVDNLIQPTGPGRSPFYSATAGTYSRSLVADLTRGGGRRLLMMRVGEPRRPISNPEGIEGLAQEYNLEVYEPATAAFSPGDFADAELIVAAHGAALGDIGFCAPGTAFVEILASAHCEPHFATLAVSAGLRYVAVRARTLNGEFEGEFEVDYDAVGEAIDHITGSD